MYDAEEFRKRAQHCVERANDSDLSPVEQAALMRMAAKWFELAADAEQMRDALGDAIEAVAGASKAPTNVID